MTTSNLSRPQLNKGAHFQDQILRNSNNFIRKKEQKAA